MGWLSSLFGAKPRKVVHLEGDGQYLCEAVGESHCQDALAQITGGKTADGQNFACTAVLYREPRNRHDTNAIVVTVNEQVVGYLSKPDAEIMSSVFKKHRLAAARAEARIVGGWTSRKGKTPDGHFRVRLDLPV